MTIDQMNNQQTASTPESRRPAVDEQTNNVQNELRNQMFRESTSGPSSQNKVMMQLLMSVQPQEQIQRTAQNQISKGYLDVKV
jgi:hypothetical protein